MPFYDGPHVWKCMRNNLLNYLFRMLFEHDNGHQEEIIMSWEVIEKAYEIDRRSDSDDRPIASKLTEAHVIKPKMSKMRVKHALQVFSATVANGIDTLVDRKGMSLIVNFIHQ